MVTRLLAATVAGGLSFFILGFLIFGLALEPNVMKPNMNTFPGLMNEEPLWIPLMLATFVQAFLLAFIFERWASISTFIGGLKGGTIVWFLISLNIQLMFLAFMNLSKNWIPPVMDVVGSVVMGGIGGGVIGLVLGMMKKE